MRCTTAWNSRVRSWAPDNTAERPRPGPANMDAMAPSRSLSIKFRYYV